jgi:hypothetical protein
LTSSTFGDDDDDYDDDDNLTGLDFFFINDAMRV